MTMEPTPEALGGDDPLRSLKRLVLATRPGFLSAVALPVLLGTVLGARSAGALDAAAFAIALAASVLVTGAANVLNDVYDDLSGADPANAARVYPFTGGSRFIQNGVMSRTAMARWGALLAAVAAFLGIALAVHAGPLVLAFGAVGLGLGITYSMPPFRLASRGLGEAAVATAFGVLPVTGAAWLQTGALSPGAALVSLAVAAWVANILLMNEGPDIRADAAAGKRTLAVRLGARPTRRLQIALHAAAAGVSVLGVAAGILHVLAPLVPAAIAIAAPYMTRGALTPERPATVLPAITFTMAAHGAGTLWLAAAVLLA